MKRFVLLLALVLCVTCLFSCASAEGVQGFNITLQANLTTGYDWEATFSDDTLAHIEGEFVQPEADPQLLGAPGYYDYVLLGDKEGTGTLTLSYMRPGDDSTLITKNIFAFTVDADLNVQIIANATVFY